MENTHTLHAPAHDGNFSLRYRLQYIIINFSLDFRHGIRYVYRCAKNLFYMHTTYGIHPHFFLIFCNLSLNTSLNT